MRALPSNIDGGGRSSFLLSTGQVFSASLGPRNLDRQLDWPIHLRSQLQPTQTNRRRHNEENLNFPSMGHRDKLESRRAPLSWPVRESDQIKPERPNENADQCKSTNTGLSSTNTTPIKTTSKPDEEGSYTTSCAAKKISDKNNGQVIREICPLIKHNKLVQATQGSARLLVHACSSTSSIMAAFNGGSQAATLPSAVENPMASIVRLIKEARLTRASQVAFAPLTGASNRKRQEHLRPLRQVNIVGNLNHSANNGLLFILEAALALALVLAALLLVVVPQPSRGSVWPFSSKSAGPTGSSGPNSAISGLLAGVYTKPILGQARRVARHSGTTNQNSSLASAKSSDSRLMPGAGELAPAGPPPVTQQFHYFWNHDQIEPSLMAEEASKVLAEAQMQTNQIAVRSGGENPVAPNAPGAATTSAHDKQQGQQQQHTISSRQADPMQLSASTLGGATVQHLGAAPSSGGAQTPEMAGQLPLVIPPAVQQQLTAMVLQMQRQQQAAMLMQPRFVDTSAPGAPVAAARRLATGATPFAPMSRLWMSASSMHPLVAPAPFMDMQASSTQAQAQHHHQPGLAMMAGFGPGQPRPSATIAGVPVYGPFMVAPSAQPSPSVQGNLQAILAAQQHLQAAMALQGPPMVMPKSATERSAVSASGKRGGGSSLLSRRKSWPLFSFGSGLQPGNERSQHLSASGSQLRPTIVLPPGPPSEASAAAAAAAAAQMALSLSPGDSLALLDAASNQLASIFAASQQPRTDHHQHHDLLGSASFARARHAPLGGVPEIRDPERQTILQLAASQLQAPYLLSAGLPSASARSAEAVAHAAMSVLKPLLATYQSSYGDQATMQSNPLSSMALNVSGRHFGANEPPFGSRLKRRHLSSAGRGQSWRHPQSLLQSTTSGPWPPGAISARPARVAAQPRPPYSVGDQPKKWPGTRPKVAGKRGVNLVEDSILVLETNTYYPDKAPNGTYEGGRPLEVGEIEKSGKSAHLPAVQEASDETGSAVRTSAKRSSRTSVTKNAPHLVPPYLSESSGGSNSTRPLFMSLLTEPPAGSKEADSNAQVRRLKRSSSLEKWPGRQASGSLLSNSGGWISMSSASPTAAPLAPASSTTVSPTTPLARRQADLTPPTPGGATSDDDSSWARSGKALKVKRIIASASVLHHQQPSGTPAKAARRSSVFAGTPVPLKALVPSVSPVVVAPPSRKEASLQAQRQQAASDPISLAESTRVVNYFQNVDNEKAASNGAQGQPLVGQIQVHPSQQPQLQPQAQSQQQPAQPQQSSASPAPVHINLAFAPPPKSSSVNRVNELQQQHQEGSQMRAQSIQAQSQATPQQLPELKRLQQQQHKIRPAKSGNGFAAQPGDFTLDSSQLLAGAQSLLGSAVNLLRLPPIIRSQSQEQAAQASPAGASNADILSAATGGNMAYANSASGTVHGVGRQGGAGGHHQKHLSAGIGFASSPGQLTSPGGPTSPDGSKASARQFSLINQPPSFLSLQSSMLNGMLAADSRSGSHGRALKVQTSASSGSQVPMFGATSQNRQSVVAAPGSGQSGSRPAASNVQQQSQHHPSQEQVNHYDRPVSADQGSGGGSGGGNYDEELISPPQPPPIGLESSSGLQENGRSSGSNSDSSGSYQNFTQNFSNEQLAALNQAGQADNFSSTFNEHLGEGMNLNEPSTGGQESAANSPGPTSEQSNTRPSEAGDQTRYLPLQQHQHQHAGLQLQGALQMQGAQQQSFGSFNQTPDQLISEAPEFSSSSQPAFNSYQANLELNQLMAGGSQNGHKVLSPQQQQQFYSQQQQQLQSLYNQHRLTQQVQEVAALNNLSPAQTGSIYSQMEQSNLSNQFQQPRQQLQHLGSNMFPVDEEAAAGTLAAAGIATYPTAAQLLAMIGPVGAGAAGGANGYGAGDLNNFVPAVSEKRDQGSDELGDHKRGKKSKKTLKQQVSHHYHFNSLNSPFEDPEFGALNSLEIAPNSGGQHRGKQKGKSNNEDEKDKEEEEEEQKPKKKGSFLRRFSLKNFFKRFKKEKKTETGNGEAEAGKGNGGGSSGESSERRFDNLNLEAH